uniref:serine--tRNA ligase n=1 Tax=Tetraselmis sp. GSL018 TaxID=582737 RepID=A0A061QX49_9CHLO
MLRCAMYGPRVTSAVGHPVFCKASLWKARCCLTNATGSHKSSSLVHRDKCRNVTVGSASVKSDNESTVETTAAEDVTAPSFRAFLDFKFIRDNVELLSSNAKMRNSSADVPAVASLYDQYVDIKTRTDDVRASRNENSKAMKGKLSDEQRAAVIEEGKQLKEELAALEKELEVLEAKLQREGQKIPNLTHPDVPVAEDEASATVLREVGSPPDFGFKPLDHTALGEALDIIDFENAAVVSGSKFYYLKGAAALLELALVNWAMSKVVARGFRPTITPDLVRESVLEKCGFQPRMENTQTYSVEGSDLCLTGTAEIPLGGLYMDRIIPEEELPIRMAAFGRCFRTEAGAAGMATKGLYRVHQFSKVEMFVIGTPEQSEALHQELLDIEADMYEELGLHFKVLDMPSCDLGAPAYRKFDIEAWMPGLGRFGEISSASNCTDFQSRRLNIRYRPVPPKEPDADGADADGKQKSNNKKKNKKAKVPTRFVHTLNGTACAVPRMIVAILETFQQEDGSVAIPEPLRPYLGGMDAIRPPAAP